MDGGDAARLAGFLGLEAGGADGEVQRALGIFSPREYGARESFQGAGRVHDLMGVVDSGCFRFYYIDREGRERTKHFVSDGGFLLSLSSFATGAELPFAIQAIAASRAFVARTSDFRRALDGSPELEALYFEHLQRMYVIKERREEDLLMKRPEDRYADFISEHPGIVRSVPQHYIATYLGIDPVSLSRIKARARRR